MGVKLLSGSGNGQNTALGNGYSGKPIAETITNGFFTVDNNWTVRYWNRAAEKLLGVQAMEIVGKNLWEKFAGILPVEFYSVYYKAFQHPIPFHFKEYWGEMGTWFDVVTYHGDDTLSVSFKSNNQPVDPGNPTQQLKALNELYRFVTQVTNDCLWEWDIQRKEIFWIDGGHKRVFGYPVQNALIPQSFWESCLHPDDKVRVLARLNKIIGEDAGNAWEEEYRFKRMNGQYAYVHDRGNIIYDGDNKARRMIGATQDITENVLLENKLIQERLTRQKEITNAVLSAQEKERADVGQELHDNLGQVLAVTKMYIQMAQKSVKNKDEYLATSCGYLENVIAGVRKIAKNLVVPDSRIIGLSDNIKNLLHDLAMVNPGKIEFRQKDIVEEELDDKLQLTIFRIVQEQVNNILKHARATHAVINLSRAEDHITLIISDDGEGCDISKEEKGVGIINIRSRADLYNGTVTITSKPGEGFQLKVVLPFKGTISDHELLKSIPE